MIIKVWKFVRPRKGLFEMVTPVFSPTVVRLTINIFTYVLAKHILELIFKIYMEII